MEIDKIKNRADFINAAKEDIHRDGINELLDYLDNSDFFDAPASTRFHLAVEGGLCQHSLDVETMLLKEVQATFGDNWPNIINPESVHIVSKFHDICKVNCYNTYMRNVKNNDTGKWEQVQCYNHTPLLPMGHGGKSIYILNRFISLTTEEALAIYWHMGAFDISQYSTMGEMSDAWRKMPLALLLHIADMKSTYLIEKD